MAANKLRVVHYLNQFFGQIGGEDMAGTTPQVKPGPLGPGLALAQALGEAGEVVATVICGDNYVADNLEQARQEILELIKQQKPDAVVAGPAFNAGRYGLACGAVGQAVAQELGIPVVSGMYKENPGGDLYGKDLYIIATADSARGMREAIPAMTALLLKLSRGEEIGSPAEEGYLPRGIRRNYFAEENGAARAVKMLTAKLKGEPFTTELPMPDFDRVVPNSPVADMSSATIALVTSGGIVPKGNPDRIESSSASKFGKYSLEGFDDLTAETHETAHGGYDPVYANQDPDRVLPLDVMRRCWPRAFSASFIHTITPPSAMAPRWPTPPNTERRSPMISKNRGSARSSSPPREAHALAAVQRW
jgi:glycine reductase complex component B subunit gamma